MRDLLNRLDWPEGRTLDWFIVKPSSILLIIVGALVLRWLIHRAVNRLVNRIGDERSGVLPRGRRAAALLHDISPAAAERREQRALTMGSLLKSIASGVIFGVATLMVLDLVGLPIGPLLASAGVLGLAIGFGAQSLIKDFLAGIFMILEDQYGVGDVVNLGDVKGTVEAVGLRVTQLRDESGTVWYVRNGEVLKVGNRSQNWARAILDITVDYDSDLEQVQAVLRDVAEKMADDSGLSDIMIEPPHIRGIERFDPDGVVLRISLITSPTKQWAVARAMRERIKVAFDQAGIKAAAAFTTSTPEDV